MAINVPTIAARPQTALSTAEPEAASFDKRWAAWQAKGVANDRAVGRTMAVAVPILIVVAAVVVYVLLGN